LGARGGWLALMIYVVLLGSAMLIRWRRGVWKTMRI
jgi:hypothetical protein